MSYSSILVHLDTKVSNAHRLQYAAALAGELDACLIGFAASASIPLHLVGSTSSPLPDTFDRRRHRARLNALREEFFATAGEGLKSIWRQEEDQPTAALIRHARAADLIVSGPNAESITDFNLAEFVCKAGRPVLLLAEGVSFRHPETALIGWKDTAEARRAVAFALPFLRLSHRTAVIAVEEAGGGDVESSVMEVAHFLRRHGIDAESRAVRPALQPKPVADILKEEGPDLVIAGAIGYRSAEDPSVGAVTRALLASSGIIRLMAG